MKDNTYAGQSQSFDDKQVAGFFSFLLLCYSRLAFSNGNGFSWLSKSKPKEDSFGSNDWEVREKLIGIPGPGVPRTLGWGVERASDSLVQNMRFPLLFFSSSLTFTHVPSC